MESSKLTILDFFAQMSIINLAYSKYYSIKDKGMTAPLEKQNRRAKHFFKYYILQLKNDSLIEFQDN